MKRTSAYDARRDRRNLMDGKGLVGVLMKQKTITAKDAPSLHFRVSERTRKEIEKIKSNIQRAKRNIMNGDLGF